MESGIQSTFTINPTNLQDAKDSIIKTRTPIIDQRKVGEQISQVVPLHFVTC